MKILIIIIMMSLLLSSCGRDVEEIEKIKTTCDKDAKHWSDCRIDKE